MRTRISIAAHVLAWSLVTVTLSSCFLDRSAAGGVGGCSDDDDCPGGVCVGRQCRDVTPRDAASPDAGGADAGREDAGRDAGVVGRPPRNVEPPSIDGEVTPGSELTVVPGRWTGDTPITFTYRWTRDGVPIPGAEGETYVVVESDAVPSSASLRVVETATNPVGSVATESAPVVVPYDPALEPDLLLDLWAERNVTEVGERVAAWEDGVAGHRFAQEQDSSRPRLGTIGGRPAVRFEMNATNLVHRTSTLASTSRTYSVIAVVDVATAGTQEFLMYSEVGNWLLALGTRSAGQLGAFASGYIDLGPQALGPQLLTWNVSAAGVSAWRGEALLGSSAFPPISLGGRIGLGGSYIDANQCDASVGRLMMFSTLDEARDARVRAHLRATYGL
ncbi:MAG TPA: hypothetical protein DEF51_08055 [Myxococcales bacterium]|nr:hypothetical protein [Myxococcales bacterium]